MDNPTEKLISLEFKLNYLCSSKALVELNIVWLQCRLEISDDPLTLQHINGCLDELRNNRSLIIEDIDVVERLIRAELGTMKESRNAKRNNKTVC